MSPGQMLLTHFIIVVVYIGQMLLCQSILFFICWFMMLKSLVDTRVSPALTLLGYDYYSYYNTVFFILVLILMTWPTHHPIYVAAGICKYFYSGMGHWLWSAWLLWWFWSCFGLPCPLCWNCPGTLHDKWCYNGHVWVMVLSCAPWIFQQMFCLTPLCTHLHSPPCHMDICKSPNSSFVCYPCLLGELGAPWWYWLLWKTFLGHIEIT